MIIFRLARLFLVVGKTAHFVTRKKSKVYQNMYNPFHNTEREISTNREEIMYEKHISEGATSYNINIVRKVQIVDQDLQLLLMRHEMYEQSILSISTGSRLRISEMADQE